MKSGEGWPGGGGECIVVGCWEEWLDNKDLDGFRMGGLDLMDD